MQDFMKRLGTEVLIFDGGMGTMIYSRGVYINTCFEDLNLSNPKLVRSIHEEYIAAGADILESNTFGANRIKLSLYGLAEKTKEINRQGVEIAKKAAAGKGYVAGAMGPMGQPIEPLGQISRVKAKEVYRESAEALLSSGPDLLLLETFENLQELALVLETIRELSDIPIITQMTFGETFLTSFGATPQQMVAVAQANKVSAVGVNCGIGPQHALDLVKQLVPLTQLPIVAQPNAGLPKEVQGRRIYLSSPEYHAEYAKRMIQSGAMIVGGCCGTTPAHIAAIRSAVKALSPSADKTVGTTKATAAKAAPKPELPMAQKSEFARKIATGQFVTSVEMSPPRGFDTARVLAGVSRLRDSGIVDAVNIPDGPRAIARMSPMALATLIRTNLEFEVILHYCCRDRNILGMQADLLGMAALGLNNVLIITGDPPKMGDYPNATAVFDVDAIGLTGIAKGLNQGFDLGHNEISEPTHFFIGVGANPGAIDMDVEVERFRRKVDAGAEFALTQPVFEPQLLLDFLKGIESFRIPVLVGVLPLVSYRNAEFLHNEVPGMSVPEKIREALRGISSTDQAQEYGIQVARESLQAVRHAVQGAYVMPPFGRVEAALKILEE